MDISHPLDTTPQGPLSLGQRLKALWKRYRDVVLVVFIVLPWLLWYLQGCSYNHQFDAGLTGRYQTITLSFPEDLNFAGEPVPYQIPDVYERMDRELMLNAWWQSQTMLLMKRSQRWFPLIEPILAKNGLPDDIKYVALVESMFENNASPRGAAGFWQLMPATAQEMGLEVNAEVDERYHPVKATEAACKYFQRTKRQLGSYTAALASYNMGSGALLRSMKNQQMRSYYNLLLNTESSRYVFRVLALKTIFQNPKEYGYRLGKGQGYQPYTYKTVKVNQAIPDLAAWAVKQGINYKILKLHNPWLRTSSLNPREGKTYTILIATNHAMAEEPTLALPDSVTAQPDSTQF